MTTTGMKKTTGPRALATSHGGVGGDGEDGDRANANANGNENDATTTGGGAGIAAAPAAGDDDPTLTSAAAAPPSRDGGSVDANGGGGPNGPTAAGRPGDDSSSLSFSRSHHSRSHQSRSQWTSHSQSLFSGSAMRRRFRLQRRRSASTSSAIGRSLGSGSASVSGISSSLWGDGKNATNDDDGESRAKDDTGGDGGGGKSLFGAVMKRTTPPSLAPSSPSSSPEEAEGDAASTKNEASAAAVTGAACIGGSVSFDRGDGSNHHPTSGILSPSSSFGGYGTPKRGSKRRKLHGAHPFTPNSASNSSFGSSSRGTPFDLASPGGAALLKILEGATDTAEYDDHHEDWDGDGDGEAAGGDDAEGEEEKKENATSQSSSEEASSSWYHAPIDLRMPRRRGRGNEWVAGGLTAMDAEGSCILGGGVYGGGGGVVDRSLKRRLRIECHPARCIPGCPPDLSVGNGVGGDVHRHDDVDARALRLFLGGGGGVDGAEEGVDAIVRWRAGCLYWQHPAVHPLPIPATTRSRNDKSPASSSSTAAASPWWKNMLRGGAALFRHVRHTAGVGTMGGLGLPPVPAIGGFGGESGEKRRGGDGGGGGGSKTTTTTTTSSSPSSATTLEAMAMQRRIEWREAFRDVYERWRSRIEVANEKRGGRDYEGTRPTRLPPASHPPSFYSVTPDQVVMFTARPTTVRSAGPHSSIDGCGEGEGDDGGGEGDGDGSSERRPSRPGHRYLPLILLSSTTLELRRTLRSLGVSLYVLHRRARATRVEDDDEEEAEGDGEEREEEVLLDEAELATLGDEDDEEDADGEDDDEEDKEHARHLRELEELRLASSALGGGGASGGAANGGNSTSHAGAEIFIRDEGRGRKRRGSSSGIDDASARAERRRARYRAAAEGASSLAVRIRGMADCHAFYELYLNRLGRVLRDDGRGHREPPGTAGGGGGRDGGRHGGRHGARNGHRADMQRLPQGNGDGDVPLLLCRSSVGPFLNATLKRLVVTSIRRRTTDASAATAAGNNGGLDWWTSSSAPNGHDRDHADRHQQQQQQPNHSAVELRGPILPCASRELLHAAASTLLEDSTKEADDSKCRSGRRDEDAPEPSSRGDGMEVDGDEDGDDDGIDGEGDDDDNIPLDVGSHYLVAHLHTHGGDAFVPSSSPSQSDGGGGVTTTLLGSSTSAWFNGDDDGASGTADLAYQESSTSPSPPPSASPSSSSSSARPDFVGNGEVMSMAVWDSARPDMLAYKTEQSASCILHHQ